uniref:Uncharacterized protein n=1 Tax=Plectus sambesii TaxID=2011161 RepID=A0A914WWJ8_9BILA
MEEDEHYPARPVWHHLASYFEIILDMLDDMPRLPYQIHFIPISDQFYEVKSGPVREHAFDLTQLMTAIERERHKNRCRFRERRGGVEGSIEGALNTERCFPTFRPRSLAHFRSWLRMTDRETVKNSVCFRPDNGPQSPRLGGLSAAANNFLSPSRGRRNSRGDGRRVSFGIISVEGIKLKTIDDPATGVEKYVSKLIDSVMHELFTTSQTSR